MAGDTWRQKPKVQRPIRVEIQIFSEINLPAMSDGQKLRNLLLNSGDGVLKFLQQNKCRSLRSRAWASWSLPLLVA
jgi:hypothetical protein